MIEFATCVPSLCLKDLQSYEGLMCVSPSPSPPQCPTVCHCGHQPPPVDPGLWDHPAGLPGGARWPRLLRRVGFHRGDGGHIPSAAAAQSHVPQQLGRPAQPRAQGTAKSRRTDPSPYEKNKIAHWRLTISPRVIPGAGHGVAAEQPAQSVRSGVAQCDGAAPGERHSNAAQPAAH